MKKDNNLPWWKTAVFYQIYPRSFCDSTGNGIGDINGIIQKVDYLVNLGIDAIWLCPFYPSPQVDLGYDISDFLSIHPDYGTMKDFDKLVKILHKNGIKLIIDMVLNHTSNEHKWFQESQKSKDNPYRDWYIWRDGKGKTGKKPPNNWISNFGGSAWEFDKQTKQWYYHRFCKEQPDLNYNNPELKKAIFKIIKFWIDKGVDGFRFDVINMLYKDSNFKDNPISLNLIPSRKHNKYLFQDHVYNQNLTENHSFCKELRKYIDSISVNKVLIGEVFSDLENIRLFYGNNDELHLAFNFDLMIRPFNAKSLQEAIVSSEKGFESFWPCYFFSNHDFKRKISKVNHNENKARILALMLLTLRGSPFIYYGEEIGLKQGAIPFNKRLDPLGVVFWYSPIKIGRDGCRTPMQWDDSKNAGFSLVEYKKIPWLPVSKDYKNVNVKSQENKKDSLLNFYKAIIKIRKQNKSLNRGKLEVVFLNKRCISYIREYGKEIKFIIMNFSKNQLIVSIKKYMHLLKGEKIFSTNQIISQSSINLEKIYLRPYEGIIIQ